MLGIYKNCKDVGLVCIKTAPFFMLASSEPLFICVVFSIFKWMISEQPARPRKKVCRRLLVIDK